MNQHHYDPLLQQTQWVRRIGTSRLGDELVSDVWSAFVSNKQPARNPVALFRHIARKRLVDLHRRQQVLRRRFTSLQPGHDLSVRQNDPLRFLVRSETGERVRAAVSRLKPKHREVIEATLNGETLKSYAERMKIPFETARTRERKAREDLARDSELRRLCTDSDGES